MQLGILAIGRAKKGPLQQLTQDWLSRLPKKGELIEYESRLPAGPARQQDEGDKLLAAFSQKAARSAKLIAMDPHGKDISSPALADMLDDFKQTGVAACYFAIGGADGHSQALLARADKTLCFGTATWPHMLFRAMLAEQLYRAEMILANHPYHRA